MRKFPIGEYVIENYGKPYIIAEMNSSHNGKIEVAKQMIDEAIACGCNAVKFQSWSAESLYSKNYYDENVIARRMVQRFSLSPDNLKELACYSREKGIHFSSTPYSEEEVDFLIDECNADFIKIASMDINNYDFLEYIAKKNRPLILSTGMATFDEVSNAMRIVEQYQEKVCILHCVSVYPVENEGINLTRLQQLKDMFVEYPVGFSDHTQGSVAAVCAVAMGSPIIEKHFTLDSGKIGWDNQMATEPEQMKILVDSCNEAYKARNMSSESIAVKEAKQRSMMRRSIVAKRALTAGKRLSKEDLDAKRPGIGIPPSEMCKIVGRVLRRDIQENEIIFLEDMI